jgi:glycosyltransferase involved in cell wall biosynthesis
VVNVAEAAATVQHAQLWRRLLRRMPSMWARWPYEAIQAALQPWAGRRFDGVLVFRLRLWPVWQLLQQRLQVRSPHAVLDMDDVESAAHARQVQALGAAHFGRLGVLLERLEVRRLRRAEQAVVRAAQATTLASGADLPALQARVPAGRLAVLPNAVRLPQPLAPAPAPAAGLVPFTVLFLGAMDYLPNEQAALWLATAIAPALRQRLGDAPVRVLLVGRNPPPALQRLQGVELHANVPSVAPYFEQCHALAVPLHMGGGTRIKIIEALAFGRPVVSTAIGAEGLGLQAEQHLLLADTTEAFVEQLLRLREDAALAQRLAAAGCRHVQEHFSIQALVPVVAGLFA